MEIHVRIDKLVLYGFNYHDHRRIGIATENELTRLIREKGLPETYGRHQENSNIHVGSCEIPRDLNPRLIGAEIARSVFNGLKWQQNSKWNAKVR
jgi:hypothetical protein